jgi:C-terminal processing protease CtpA/Prc
MRVIVLLILTCVLGTVGRADMTNMTEVRSPIPRMGGIGAVVAEKEGIPTIIELLPQGPADQAGLKVNDKIIQVDDKKTKDLTLKDAVLLIRGPNNPKTSAPASTSGQ